MFTCMCRHITPYLPVCVHICLVRWSRLLNSLSHTEQILTLLGVAAALALADGGATAKQDAVVVVADVVLVPADAAVIVADVPAERKDLLKMCWVLDGW